MLNNENQRAPPIRILMQIIFAYISREKKPIILYYKTCSKKFTCAKKYSVLMKSLNEEALVMLCNHEVKRNNNH